MKAKVHKYNLKRLGKSVKTIFIASAVMLLTVAASSRFEYREVKNESFERGEHLEYKAHYGFLNAGYAKIDVTPKLYRINGRVCYKVDVFGRTIGSADLFIRVRDTWRSYVDTAAFVPQKFFRHIEEGKYRKTEETYFNHPEKKARVIDKKRKIDTEYKVPENAQDIVSGFFYMRNIDFKRMRIGEVVTMPGFLEEESYAFDLKYMGKEIIRTKVGKMRVMKLVPIMPENDLFDGEGSIRVWISDDKNKIPVKIEADMFIGAVEIDLRSYAGLKHKLNLVK